MIGKCPQCGDPRGDQGGMTCQANGCCLLVGDDGAEIARLTAERDALRVTADEAIVDCLFARKEVERLTKEVERLTNAAYVQRGQPLEVITSIETVRRAHEVTMQERDKARAEIEQLKFRIADYEDERSKVLNEQCPPDERHCTCVPVLRADLREEQQMALDAANEYTRFRNVLIEIQNCMNKALSEKQ